MTFCAYIRLVILSIFMQMVVPENIHTHTTGGISEFRRGGGYIDWNSEDTGGVFNGPEFRRNGGGGHFQESIF